jgi:hypothetical protein
VRQRIRQDNAFSLLTVRKIRKVCVRFEAYWEYQFRFESSEQGTTATRGCAADVLRAFARAMPAIGESL